MQFRNMLSSWLRRKIFAPIAKINDFYDRVDGKKVLIVPDIEWNHMSLFDMGDYTQALTTLITQGGEGQPPKLALQTLYRSLGIEYEDEQRKIRRETIDNIIHTKEVASLSGMSLDQLRALKDEDIIPEAKNSPLPGEESEEAQQNLNLPGMDGGMPPLGGMGAPAIGPAPEMPVPPAPAAPPIK